MESIDRVFTAHADRLRVWIVVAAATAVCFFALAGIATAGAKTLTEGVVRCETTATLTTLSGAIPAAVSINAPELAIENRPHHGVLRNVRNCGRLVATSVARAGACPPIRNIFAAIQAEPTKAGFAFVTVNRSSLPRGETCVQRY